MFAGKSLLEHAIRGVIGFGSIWYAAHIAAAHPLISVGLGIVTLVAFRGCPVCWTVGFVETAWNVFGKADR